MGLYRSERDAVWFALNELKRFLPDKPVVTDEWGMILYRSEDKDGGWWYQFQTPYKGDGLHWDPVGRPFPGVEEVAYCHTHPNNSPFSSTDHDTALGLKFPFPRCTGYMVNHSGAYSYNGKLFVPVTPPPPGTSHDEEKVLTKKQRDEELCEGEFAKYKDKKYGEICYGRNAPIRYGTLWGTPYKKMYDDFYKK